METPKISGGKKASKKPIRVKTVFTTPFPLNWSPLPQNDMHFILTTLKDKLISLGLEKKEVKVFRPWRKRKRGPDTSSTDMDTNKMADSPKGGWTDVTIRRQLALGINEVTKALERNQLKLVLVCKSVKPKHMTSHLIALSASRGVPACQVPRLSESMAEPLGLKSVLALGFRNRAGSNKAEAFADAVEAIIPKVPSLNVPWLQSTSPGIKLQHNDTTKKKDEQKAGQKRKLEPFQVKKIVAKKGKIKRKRKNMQAK